MALFKKEEEIINENMNEDVTDPNIEKIEKMLNELNVVDSIDENKILEYYKLHYFNGVECIYVINVLKKYNVAFNNANIFLDLYMLVKNKLIFEKIIFLYKNYAFSINKDSINYMRKSRPYYVDIDSWYARVFNVISSNIDYDKALVEDKMRVGVYPSISKETLQEILDKLRKIEIDFNIINNEISNNKQNLNSIKNDIESISKKTTDKIESISKTNIQEMDKKKEEILETINRALNLNPSSKKELLKEIQNQYDVLEAFDEKIDIATRYDKLIKNKQSNIIYHPKFDDILKYILAGNTVCLDGPSKCGKTQLANSLALLLNTSFSNLGNIYDEVSQIDGYYDFNTNYNKPTFQDRFENGGIVLMKNINTAPIQAIYSLNNIINNFSYNPYIFGDKKITTPNKNFRLIMTNNNTSISGNQIDNLVTVKMDYDTNFESSLTDDKELIEFLFELRKHNVEITTSTFIDFTTHQKLKLFTNEKIIEDYIVSKNSSDLLNSISSNINQDNKYTKSLKLVLTK